MKLTDILLMVLVFFYLISFIYTFYFFWKYKKYKLVNINKKNIIIFNNNINAFIVASIIILNLLFVICFILFFISSLITNDVRYFLAYLYLFLNFLYFILSIIYLALLNNLFKNKALFKNDKEIILLNLIIQKKSILKIEKINKSSLKIYYQDEYDDYEKLWFFTSEKREEFLNNIK